MNWEAVYNHLVAAGCDLLILWALVLMAACAAVFGRELWPRASALDQVDLGIAAKPSASHRPA